MHGFGMGAGLMKKYVILDSLFSSIEVLSRGKKLTTSIMVAP
jgi:hypothetical protein